MRVFIGKEVRNFYWITIDSVRILSEQSDINWWSSRDNSVDKQYTTLLLNRSCFSTNFPDDCEEFPDDYKELSSFSMRGNKI